MICRKFSSRIEQKLKLWEILLYEYKRIQSNFKLKIKIQNRNKYVKNRKWAIISMCHNMVFWKCMKERIRSFVVYYVVRVYVVYIYIQWSILKYLLVLICSVPYRFIRMSSQINRPILILKYLISNFLRVDNKNNLLF